MIDFKELIKAGVHFGHQTARWEPKMAPYIWGHRQGVHLIDVSKTAHQLEKASKFLEDIATQGKPIFWVGTKKAAQEIVQQAGQSLQMPYVTHRWVGGSLTNYGQVKKAVTKLLHFEDVLSKSDEFHYTKKELNTFQKKVDRLHKCVGGITKLTWPIGALVIVDAKKEQTALKEAIVSNIPVVALVDTNSDPTGVSYVIPANDDSPKSISCIVSYLSEAVERGKKKKAEKVVEAKEAVAQEAEAKKALKEKVAGKTPEDGAAKDVKPSPKKAKEASPRKVTSEKEDEKKSSSSKPKAKTPTVKSGSSSTSKTSAIQASGKTKRPAKIS